MCLNSNLFNHHASKDYQCKMLTMQGEISLTNAFLSVLCRFETYQQYASCVCSNEEKESQITRLVEEEGLRRGRVYQAKRVGRGL